MCVPAYEKLTQDKFMVNTNRINNGLYIADRLIEVKSVEDRTFPIGIVNVSGNEVIIREGTMITIVERCEMESYFAIIDHIGDEFNTQVS